MAASKPPPAHPDPPLSCDIVMKGGITSGVVYPGAAVELAARYRFRAIGGTSAGAIAAAIVAAAEHRRQHDSTSGFQALGELADELAGPDGGQPLLLKLFQPDPATKPLFDVMMAFMKHKRTAAFRMLGIFPRFPALGALIAVACGALLAFAGLSPWVGLPAIGAALVLLAVGLATDVLRAVLALPANGFGVCTLGPGGTGPGPALTAWLHEKIQEIAGCTDEDAPLTFADLWGVDETDDLALRHQLLLARSWDPGLRDVDLQMMTTDLTHGRPWRLPAPFQRHEDRLEFGGELLFKPAELRRFFPREVVDYMENCGRPISEDRARHLPDHGRDFRRFPIGPDLPVLVATRMSLSFPGLICAIPLWNLDYAADGRHPRLERVLFSDGGITSNFPVHFFDAPLPRRPTFGLHLTTFPEGEQPPDGVENQGTAIVPPVPPARPAPEEPRTIESLGQFLVAIKDAMQNWRDNTQARQPGFRDRMVHIRLGAGEGGMTLTMNRKKVLELSARGGEAAKVLADLFAVPSAAADTRWNQHRLVRFRIAAAATEQTLASFSGAYEDPAPGDGISMPYLERVDLARPGVTGIGPYCFKSKAQLRRAQNEAHAYRRQPPELYSQSLDNGAPRPPSVLRIVPPT